MLILNRIEEMLKAASISDLNYDEKCPLALLTIASIEELVEAGEANPKILTYAKTVLRQDDDVRKAMVFYWIGQSRASDQVTVREILLT
ncbi:hypothetical protein [Mesorhizobium temperatum]|uniref:Uncharacterized protein n=1 Tax=Mesorhizobium temperatum TaxID=241416 RepID=A0A271LG17_9HYPH|nr:hypothetical protein [Mesorhizobium temperatum]PAQ07039.1 hypothetical protein CIT26_21645 [Mesorhizobium temperatum]